MSEVPDTSKGGAGQPDKTPLRRLASFKPPRDLTLGAGVSGPSKTEKRVSSPNCNVVRKKNKAGVPNLRDGNKKNEKKRRNKPDNKKQSGPAIIKSSGVFSEGLSASERVAERSSYSRDTDIAPTLARAALRIKSTQQINKEQEERKMKKALGASALISSDEHDAAVTLASLRDAPIRLPISGGGTLYPTKKKVQKLAAQLQEASIETESQNDDTMRAEPQKEKKKIPQEISSDVKTNELIKLLTSDKPKMLLVELPHTLPFHGPDSNSAQTSKEKSSKPGDGRCQLRDLEEGKIGKIQIYKSGKVKMCLGDTQFDVSIGTMPSFRQDFMSVSVDTDTKTGTMINLGGIDDKLVITPDWDSLFKEVI